MAQLTQRDRAKRAKMVARYKKINKLQQQQTNTATSKSTTSPPPPTVEGRDDIGGNKEENSENRDSSNYIADNREQFVIKDTSVTKNKPVLQSSIITKASHPIATTTTPHNTSVKPSTTNTSISNTSSSATTTAATPPRVSAKQKALAMSSAKKKLAASRLVSATNNKSPSKTTVSTSSSMDKPSSIDKSSQGVVDSGVSERGSDNNISTGFNNVGDRGRARSISRSRSNQMLARRHLARSRSPAPSKLAEFEDEVATTTPNKKVTSVSSRAQILNRVANNSSAAGCQSPVVKSDIQSSSSGNNSANRTNSVAAMKSQRERFLRMKAAVNSPSPKPITKKPVTQVSPVQTASSVVQTPVRSPAPVEAYLSSPESSVESHTSSDYKMSSSPQQQQTTQGGGTTTDYKKQRELYNQMRSAMADNDASSQGGESKMSTSTTPSRLDSELATKMKKQINKVHDIEKKIAMKDNDVDNKSKKQLSIDEELVVKMAKRKMRLELYLNNSNEVKVEDEDEYNNTSIVPSYSKSSDDSSYTELVDIDTTTAGREELADKELGEDDIVADDPPLLQEGDMTTSVSETSSEEDNETKEEEIAPNGTVDFDKSEEEGENKVVDQKKNDDEDSTSVGDGVSLLTFEESKLCHRSNSKDSSKDSAIKDDKPSEEDIEKVDSFPDAFQDIDADMFDKASSSSDVINAFKNSDTVKALIQGSTAKDEEKRQDDGFTSITDDPFKSNMRDQDDGFGAINSDPFVKEANVFDNFTTSDWPADLDGAFSPMSWGTQKSNGFGGGDKWKADFPESNDDQKISTTENIVEEQKDEKLIWDAPSADFDVKEEEKRDDSPVADDGTSNEIVSKRKQSGADQSECSSAVYEGFGSVESSDDDDEEDEDDDIEMNRSNDSDTQASATEFDPQSMFGEDDDNEEEEDDVLPPEKIEDDVFPIDKSTTGSQSKPSDDSKSISFQSLNSGSQIKYTAQPPVPVSSSSKAPVPDSPAGTESLESWWQSRYASTQHQDINSAVQDALSKRVADSEPSDETSSPEVSVVSSPKLSVDVEETPQVMSNSEHRRSKSESSSKSRQKKHEPLSPADSTGEDSIFSGLSVDDCTSLPKQATKQHTRVASQTLPVNSNETEDIFAGVSSSHSRQLSGVSAKHSRQLSNNRIQESNTVAMKSLFDGASTVADSAVLGLSGRQSRMTLTANKVEESTQKSTATKIDDKKKESPPVAVNKEPNEALFMPDADYGVIDLKNSETSPANSDITSSVIDYEFSRKSSHKKKNDALDAGGEVEKLSAIKSADDISSQEEANDYEEEEDVDMMNPKSEDMSQSKQDYSKSFSRGVSAMSDSRGVSDDGVTSYPSNSSSSLGETNHKGTVSALLSQLGCGTFAASSFAFCAMNQGKKRSILFVLYCIFITYSTIIYFFIFPII